MNRVDFHPRGPWSAGSCRQSNFKCPDFRQRWAPARG
jgi:hypothetical protein